MCIRVSLATTLLGLVAILAVNSGGLVYGEESPSDVKDVRATIVKSSADYEAAFNRHDAKAVAAFWTADAEYVDEVGERFVGRDAIQEEHAKFFEAVPDAKIRITVDQVKVLGPSTAIEDGHTSMTPSPTGAPARASYTAVHVKQNDKWLLASVRDTRLEMTSAFKRLEDMEWLVGDWAASHGRVLAELHVEWIAEKSFLQLRYKISEDGHELSSSTEVIGWDPIDANIKSWTFSSGGGRAVGVWTPTQDAWTVDSTGISHDGLTSKTKLIWTRLEGGALGWKSTQSTVAGVTLDDAREVVFKRQ